VTSELRSNQEQEKAHSQKSLCHEKHSPACSGHAEIAVPLGGYYDDDAT
jgi:hypothetical protein